MMKEILSILGAVLILGCPIPYLIDIVWGKARPNVVTWGTWTLLTGIAAAALFVAGQPRPGLLLTADTIGTFSIVLFGLKHGIAKLDAFDIWCQVGAIVGLVMWLVFNSPIIAITMTIAIDFIATIPTLRHSWALPDEETVLTYALGSLAALFTLLSLNTFNFSGWIYPLYLMLNNAALVITIRHGQSKGQSAIV